MSFLKYFILLIFLVFISCGLPQLELYKDLNAPTKLEIDEYVAGNKIVIKFICYNYEENFEGYNIYIASTSDTLVDSLSTKVGSHITIGNDGFLERNHEIEENYIIKNSNSNIPTISAKEILEAYNLNTDPDLSSLSEKSSDCYTVSYGDGEEETICDYLLKPFEFEFEITILPDGSSLNPINDYKIVVSAYDTEQLIESKASNQVITNE